MSFETFKASPMSMKHPAYEHSFFHLETAPENASGEVLLASLYRYIGFSLVEGKVTATGQSFSTRLTDGVKVNNDLATGIKDQSWRFILDTVVNSPKQPGQPKKKLIQLSPIVPDATLYSSSARFVGNPWNPGPLIASIIKFGSNTDQDAEKTWDELFRALSIDDGDDIWARFLSQEFTAWRDPAFTWSKKALGVEDRLARNDKMKYPRIPAKRFVKDLGSLIKLKNELTRRQWISLIESSIRLGTASHVIWVCAVNRQIWKMFRQALSGTPLPSRKEFDDIVMSVGIGHWRYGETVLPVLKEMAREYILARVCINYCLYLVESLVHEGKLNYPSGQPIQLKSLDELFALAQHLWHNRSIINPNTSSIFEETSQLLERDAGILACTKGIPANIFEFLRYSLGQRRTIDPEARNYDQGYWIRKNGSAKNAPYVLSAGPVSLMSMAYCCSQETIAPRTIDDFYRHMGQYGVSINHADLSTSGLRQSLRGLGLVIDSPDAEGGMIVLNPFNNMES